MLDRFEAKLDGAFDLVDRESWSDGCGAVLPGERLIVSAESMRPYESDGLAAYRSLPAAVALPADAAEAAGVLKICRELGVPVVARGAGTGLSGGALPFPGSVLLALGKLNRILDDRPGGPHRPGAARRAQPGDLGGGAAATACSTPPTRRRSWPARSAATSPRTPAACTA